MKSKMFVLVMILTLMSSFTVVKNAEAKGLMVPEKSPLTEVICMTFTRDIQNDADSGVLSYWAFDYYQTGIVLCPVDTGYDLGRADNGDFVTFGGTSPSGNGIVGSGIVGTLSGSWTGIHVEGTVDPNAPAVLDPADFQCDEFGVCPGYSPTLAEIFLPGYVVTYSDDWQWVYTVACENGETQVWVNSSEGNSGDITLLENCPTVTVSVVAVVKKSGPCAQIYEDLAKLANTEEAERHLANQPFCRDDWYPGYYWDHQADKKNDE